MIPFMKVMLWSSKVIIFCNSTAMLSKALFLVKPPGNCHDSQYCAENQKHLLPLFLLSGTRQPPVSRSVSHSSLPSRSLNRSKFAFPKHCDPAFCIAPTPRDLELYHLIVTTPNTAPSFHIPDEKFHVCKYNVQQITSTCKLLHSFYSGKYHQGIGGTFWIACVQVHCPSTAIRWLRSFVRTSICKCELWRRPYPLFPDQTVGRRQPPQFHFVVCPLILTHELLAGSPFIPRQMFPHSNCCLI